MKKILLVAVSALVLSGSGNVWAGGDVGAGKLAVEQHGCVACHGAGLNAPIDPTYPKLAGQAQSYLQHSLTAYRRVAGASNSRVNAIMNGQAAALTDQDIVNISTYIASLPGTLILKK